MGVFPALKTSKVLDVVSTFASHEGKLTGQPANGPFTAPFWNFNMHDVYK